MLRISTMVARVSRKMVRKPAKPGETISGSGTFRTDSSASRPSTTTAEAPAAPITIGLRP
jgi:hypothetical protein